MGVAYRKLRNTMRYILGAVDGLKDWEFVPAAAHPADLAADRFGHRDHVGFLPVAQNAFKDLQLVLAVNS